MERLKGTTILIGKEPGQGRLLISVGGKTAALGHPGSVPNSVSRCKPAEGMAHAKLTVDQSGNMTLTNMKVQNVSYVNGNEIASKRVTSADSIGLGKDRYAINLSVVLDAAKKILAQTPPPPKEYDISHLQLVWEEYDKELEAITIRQQELGKKRMLPIMLGSFSGVATAVLPAVGIAAGAFVSGPIAAISLGMYIYNYRKKDTSYEDRKAATDKFTEHYHCPNPDCDKFLGNISYKLLKSQYSMQCPYCKSKYVEK